MTGWLGGAYLWVLAAHIIFVIFWVAGLFMLGRYLVYHAEAAPGSGSDARWTERTVKLRRIIVTPGIVLVWLLGIALVLHIGLAGQGWLHAKLVLVLGLSGWHGWAVGASKKLSSGKRPYRGKTLRLLNEVPALALLVIVPLAVVKPF